MAKEARYLILKSTDIYSSNNADDYFNKTIDNTYGTVTQNRRSITWKNVNLRKIMGDEYYNMYSKFTIRCISRDNGVTTTGQMLSTLTESNEMVRVVFYLSGLSFDPSVNKVMIDVGYLSKLPNIGSAGLAVPTTVYYNNDENFSFVFFKPAGEISLKIDILNYTDEQFYQPTASTSLHGHSVYNFEIVGIV
jgi:hypothetical protein